MNKVQLYLRWNMDITNTLKMKGMKESEKCLFSRCNSYRGMKVYKYLSIRAYTENIMPRKYI